MAAALLWSPAAAGAAAGVVDLRTQTDLRIVGADAGRAIAPAGDVNGDGTEDLLVSAGPRAFVLFGPFSSGAIDLDTIDSGGFRIDLGGETVYSLAGVGDMNGDGLDDVVIGDPGRDIGTQTDAGSAYVVFGKASSSPVSVASLGAQGFRMDGQAAYGLVGWSVSGAGDVNGDHRPDLIVGGYSAERAYVVFGKATTENIALGGTGAWGFQIFNSEFGIDWLGQSVLGVGDMNGDHLDDVAVGAPRACGSPRACDGEGAVWVIWGKASVQSVNVSNLGDQGFRIYGPSEEHGFPRLTGRDMALAGDMNADGLQDILISAPYGGSSAFVVWGKGTTTPVYLDALGDAGFETIGPDGCCELALAGNRDLNGDGRPDILVGVPESTLDTDRAAWAIFGKPPGRTVLLAPGAPRTLLYDGIPNYQRPGLSVATMDLNLDGRSDVLIGTPGEFRSAPDYEYGVVRAIFSRPLPPVSASLAPAEATNEAGQEHCVTAELSDTASAPASGFLVRFEVSANNIASGSARSDGDGRARFCYTGTRAGTDAIFAYADTNEDGVQQESANEPGASAMKAYNPGRPATLTLSPASAENALETTHCVTATVTDEFGNGIREGSVHFTVAGGRAGNTASGSQPVNGGTATFCYTGPALGPSTDAITAYHDTDGNGVADPGEPAGSAQKDWVLPPSSDGCRVTGAGQARSEAGRKVNFRLDARAFAATVSGHVRHDEHGKGAPVKIRSFRLAALACAADRSTASIFGEGSYNGRGRYLLRADVRDGGDTGADSYRLRLSSGFDSGDVRPLSGDISIVQQTR